jgi:hypothetical protein
MDMNHRVFDRIDAVVGEQVWNLADVTTTSGIMRVGGNKRASSLVIASQRPQRTRCAAASAKIFEEVTGQRQSHLCQAADVDLMGILRDRREFEAKCRRDAS